MSRYTTTSFFWPILQALSLACISVDGFQSGSYTNTLHEELHFEASSLHAAYLDTHASHVLCFERDIGAMLPIQSLFSLLSSSDSSSKILRLFDESWYCRQVACAQAHCQMQYFYVATWGMLHIHFASKSMLFHGSKLPSVELSFFQNLRLASSISPCIIGSLIY